MARNAGYWPVVAGVVVAVVLAVAMFSGPPAQAASGDDAKGASYKIGVVDMELILQQYKKRIEKYDSLQKEVDKLQTDIDAMSAKIEKAKTDYEKNKSTMAEEDAGERRNQIEADYATYRIELEKRQRMIDTREKSVLEEVLEDVRLAIEKIGNRDNYHLILNSKSGPRGSVLFHSPTIDITPAVLAELNSNS